MNATVTATTAARVIDSLWESIRVQTRTQAELHITLSKQQV